MRDATYLRRARRPFVLLLAGVMLVGVAGATLAATGRAGPLLSTIFDAEPRDVRIDASEATLTLEELTRRADVVVIATPQTRETKRFTSMPEIPASERDPRIYANGAFADTTIEVREYLKGAGPARLSVRRLASTPQLIVGEPAPELVLGQEYVLFLERGRGIWLGGFVVMGQQGSGVIANDTARLPAHGTVPLADLRRMTRP